MHTWHSSFAKSLKRIAQPRAYMMTPGKESSAPETNVLQEGHPGGKDVRAGGA